MTPKVKIFVIVFPYSSTGHRDMFCGQFGENQPLRSCQRSHGLPPKKTCAPRDSSQPLFCRKWADRAQNSVNVVTPWHVHVYQIWSGSTAVCQTYSGKIDFFGPKSQYNNGFQPTINIVVTSELVNLANEIHKCLSKKTSHLCKTDPRSQFHLWSQWQLLVPSCFPAGYGECRDRQRLLSLSGSTDRWQVRHTQPAALEDT